MVEGLRLRRPRPQDPDDDRDPLPRRVDHQGVHRHRDLPQEQGKRAAFLEGLRHGLADQAIILRFAWMWSARRGVRCQSSSAESLRDNRGAVPAHCFDKVDCHRLHRCHLLRVAGPLSERLGGLAGMRRQGIPQRGRYKIRRQQPHRRPDRVGLMVQRVPGLWALEGVYIHSAALLLFGPRKQARCIDVPVFACPGCQDQDRQVSGQRRALRLPGFGQQPPGEHRVLQRCGRAWRASHRRMRVSWMCMNSTPIVRQYVSRRAASSSRSVPRAMPRKWLVSNVRSRADSWKPN